MNDLPVPLPKHWPKHVRSAVMHIISLAHLSLVHTRSWAANSPLARVRLEADLDAARTEVALLREELRIKDARMARIDPRRRPRYPPVERLAILALRAARAWSMAETARRFLVEPQTIAVWMKRVDEQGPSALVRTPAPVNRFPDFARDIVRRLKTLAPSMGKVRIAQTLARAGLHLAATTAKRMLEETPPPNSAPATDALELSRKSTPVIARHPNHAWAVDLTLVPTLRSGFWVPWTPFARPQMWPFAWWVAAVIDLYSRRVMGFAVFAEQPTGAQVRAFLDTAIRAAGTSPRYLVSDLGSQFVGERYERWCKGNGILRRYASKGSILATAIIERFFRSAKTEYLRKTTVSLSRDAFRKQLVTYVDWYHEHRPHQGLAGCTPFDVYEGRRPANRRPRFEPRPRWPRGARCAAPQAPPRDNPGARLQLVVDFADDDKLLSIVELKLAA